MSSFKEYYTSHNVLLFAIPINDRVEAFISSAINHCIECLDEHYKDVEFSHDTRILSIDDYSHYMENTVRVSFELYMKIAPCSRLYINENHLKLKNPNIIEDINDHSGLCREWVGVFRQYMGEKLLEFGTNLGFYPEPFFIPEAYGPSSTGITS